MTPKEIRFPAQRLRNPIPRPLIWIGILLAMLLCFALFFHPTSLGNVVRDFSSTEKVHIVNYYTVATSHLPPQKEGELSFPTRIQKNRKLFWRFWTAMSCLKARIRHTAVSGKKSTASRLI